MLNHLIRPDEFLDLFRTMLDHRSYVVMGKMFVRPSCWPTVWGVQKMAIATAGVCPFQIKGCLLTYLLIPYLKACIIFSGIQWTANSPKNWTDKNTRIVNTWWRCCNSVQCRQWLVSVGNSVLHRSHSNVHLPNLVLKFLFIVLKWTFSSHFCD